jgi:hypothetical protein
MGTFSDNISVPGMGLLRAAHRRVTQIHLCVTVRLRTFLSAGRSA